MTSTTCSLALARQPCGKFKDFATAGNGLYLHKWPWKMENNDSSRVPQQVSQPKSVLSTKNLS